MSRSTSKHGDFVGSSRTRSNVDKKIEEGIPDGKNIFKCWTCNEFGHYASKCPKKEKKYKRKLNPRRPRSCLYVNEDEESNKKV